MSAARLLALAACAALAGGDPQFGYQRGDVTQGIGYGHHLHPFYYQGASRRYYNCAIEDEWTPLSEDKPKTQKINLPKKYAPEEFKARTKERHNRRPKIINVVRQTKAMQKRGDREIFDGSKQAEKDHAKLVHDINSLSENQESTKLPSLPGPDHTYIEETTPVNRKISAYEVHEGIVGVRTAPIFATVPRPVYGESGLVSTDHLASSPYAAPTKTSSAEVNRGGHLYPLALAGPPYRLVPVPVTYRKVRKFAHRPTRLSLLEKFIKFIPDFL